MKKTMKEWNERFRDTNDISYIRHIAYITYAICCKKAHDYGHEEKNFKNYPGYPYIYSSSTLKRMGDNPKMQDGFNFGEYDSFICNGNIKMVDQHMNELCERYLASKK